jgi:Sec7-like guanine-nucleotide exchange factor
MALRTFIDGTIPSLMALMSTSTFSVVYFSISVIKEESVMTQTAFLVVKRSFCRFSCSLVPADGDIDC